ncbi:hypothetical protein D3H65_00720 [Paraflavitalea soli]|uniref:Uncharacterized protein n=1 Tax=Paraflavitalea soli TaxID=2315862 RepID=A0A3B7MHM7_9BACT|nr:hypothetical protein [Paraflavitalea soli]AXY72586.1 hypothetical protein D3H65_00720 [Paraflavitalea soli]
MRSHTKKESPVEARKPSDHVSFPSIFIPVLIYITRRIRKSMLRLKAQALWLEEDFIPGKAHH